MASSEMILKHDSTRAVIAVDGALDIAGPQRQADGPTSQASGDKSSGWTELHAVESTEFTAAYPLNSHRKDQLFRFPLHSVRLHSAATTQVPFQWQSLNHRCGMSTFRDSERPFSSQVPDKIAYNQIVGAYFSLVFALRSSYPGECVPSTYLSQHRTSSTTSGYSYVELSSRAPVTTRTLSGDEDELIMPKKYVDRYIIVRHKADMEMTKTKHKTKRQASTERCDASITPK